MSDTELQVQALYIGDTNTAVDFDTNQAPASGLEYLLRVQREAKHCPMVVVADIDIKKFEKKQTLKVKSGTGCMPAPNGYAPSTEWQRQQTIEFANLRMALSRYKAKHAKRIKNSDSKPTLPKKDDVIGWCRLCLGSHVQLQIAARDNAYAAEDAPTGTCTGKPPLLSMLVIMCQSVVEQVLEYHLAWFEAAGFSPEQGRWLYALLAVLEKPLSPEACFSVRQLARLCCNLRASLESSEDSQLVHLNLLICLVARYFDQIDLADNPC